jgi:hypothetical protein
MEARRQEMHNLDPRGPRGHPRLTLEMGGGKGKGVDYVIAASGRIHYD